MVVRTIGRQLENSKKSLLIVMVLVLVTISPLIHNQHSTSDIRPDKINWDTSDNSIQIWSDGGQVWPQFGRTGDRIGDILPHSPDGGAGFQHPDDSSELMSIVSPEINWEYGDYEIGNDALATPIANLENSISKDIEANERCGGSSLFIIIIQTQDVSGTDHSILKIIEGEDSDLAWQVDLGATETIKASPVVLDIDGDNKQEIIIAYDAGGSVFVEAWSPRLTCTVTGWAPGGNSAELLWTWSDDNLMISSEEGPYSSNLLGGHKPTTQPLLADLDLDGDAELILTLIDEITDEPVVLALPLPTSGVPNPIWQVSLDKGSHPSDPSFAITDDDTGYILLTTIEANSGGMWVWKIESDTGDSSWSGGLNLNNIDGDNDVPHIRLPGPIIANLDSDDVPEMIITIPTDADGSGSADGAEYIGMEISDGEEIWSFNAVNGYADAPPTVIDTDNDDIYDRVCWVTWWQTTTARHGELGCHDVSGIIPNQIWNRDLEQSSGTPNDEIAVSAATWMDIDGEGEQEIIVAFGRTLWAFDGEEGTSSAINTEWSDEIALSHRTWSTPSLADIDGDATLDVVIGSMVISNGLADIRPLIDERSIEFNPNAPDPGEKVTVTAFFENAGTKITEEGIDAILYADGEEIGRYRSGNMQPIDPTGPGSFSSFDVEWEGELGDHIFELQLDPYRNISQSRYDNDNQSRTLSIIPTYNASFEIQTNPIRINPGESGIAIPTIRSTGRLAGIWSIDIDASNLPQGWTWETVSENELTNIEIESGNIWKPEIVINAPIEALGSDSGYLILKLSLDQDANISVEATIPIEANRTRGLSLRGPDGTSFSEGHGLIGEFASAWLMIENVGNAVENQITISWDNTAWGSELKLFNSANIEQSALILDPGESKEMSARLMVPNDAAYEEVVTTPLMMCVGSGEEEICQTIFLDFIASRIVIENNHLRSVPSNELMWTLSADIPNDRDAINWSLVDIGMAISGWNWYSDENISIIDGIISIQGNPGTRVNGNIYLDLPEDSHPMYHRFSKTGNIPGLSMGFSIEILQIYRASLSIISPVEMPSYIEIGEEKIVILRLENQGNGEDSFQLSYKLILNENISTDPGIMVTFSNNPLSLEAGSLRSIPVSIILPPSTPAKVDINIEIIMKSSGNISIIDSKNLIIQAKQNHVWEIDAQINQELINGNEYTIIPGERIQIDINAKNLGNMLDDIELISSTNIQLVNGDQSIGWSVGGDFRYGVLVNESIELKLNVTIPKTALVGSTMNVETIIMANTDEIERFSFNVGVEHISGWSILARDADLEIEKNGSGVDLTIIQLGNLETRPYISVLIVGEDGWIVEVPAEISPIIPGGEISLMLNITPPSSAQYGKSVELNVRVREGDSSSITEITLPIRVAAVYNFTMTEYDDWIVSPSGGYPLVSLNNLGNSPTTISLQILSLPQNWTVLGPDKVVLATNEEVGLPLKLVPSQYWDGSVRTIRILANDNKGNQQEIIIDTKFNEYSWGNSPFINSYTNDDALVHIMNINELEDTVIDDEGNILKWIEQGWILTTELEGFIYGNITINQINKLPFIVKSFDINKRAISCEISGDFGDVHSSCTIATNNLSFSYSILLTDDKGDIIDYGYGFLNNIDTNMMINMSSESWEPEPGMRYLNLRILDSKGNQIVEYEKNFEIRKSNWNIGLNSVDLVGTGEDQMIEITAERYGHSQLLDADCTIELTQGDLKIRQKIDMSTRVILTPKPKFERPLEIQDGSEITVIIGCLFPWDLDANQADNEIRKVLTGGAIDNERTIVTSLSMITAFAIIALSATISWILKNRREMREFEEMAENAIKNKLRSESKIKEIDKIKSEAPKIEELSTSDSEDDNIALLEVKKNNDDVENNRDEHLDEFERRLKRIRRDA